MEEPNSLQLLKILAPFLALTALATLLIVVLAVRFAPPSFLGGAMATPNIVTFDVVKFANAQRAVASAFLKKGSDMAEANALFTNLSERTRKTITEVAGAGTLVMVKQTVVQGGGRDITNEVLAKLGLPTDTPTKDPTAYVLDDAPTMLARPVQAEPAPAIPHADGMLP